MKKIGQIIWAILTILALGIDIFEIITNVIAGDYLSAVLWLLIMLMVLSGPLPDIIRYIKLKKDLKKVEGERP
jgi:membrane protein CcdC involved in cytochrome C biogenesis